MFLYSLMKMDMSTGFDRAASIFLLVIRVYVSWVFLKSGYLKITDWESTLALFEYEYRVPLLSPEVAALVGTAGEIVFATALIIGLFGRWSALGVFAVNTLAVISYRHVLLQDGFEAAIAQHYLWGLMLTTLVIYGPGKLSADWLVTRGLNHRSATTVRARAV